MLQDSLQARRDAEYPTFWRYGMLVLLSAAAALAYFCRNAMSPLESTIRKDLDLTPSQTGMFMGAFFVSYAIAGVPAGWLGQRWGTRLALATYMAAWSISTMALGLAPDLVFLVAAQLVIGASQAGLMPCAVSSVSHWFPESRRAFASAWLGGGMQIGAIVSAVLIGWLLPYLDWRNLFFMYGLPGIVGALAFYTLFRNFPKDLRGVNGAELSYIRSATTADPHPEARDPVLWQQILRNPTLWLLCGQQFCRAAGYMFFASWFPSFLQKTRGISIGSSGVQQSLVLASALAGTYLGGLAVDAVYSHTGSRMRSRAALGVTSLMTCGILIVLAYFAKDPSLAVALLSLGSFFAAVAGPCAFAAAIDVGGNQTPFVVAVMNTAGNIAAAICPMVVGAFFEATENWNLVLWGFAGVYFVGAACWAFIDLEPSGAADAPS